MFSMCLAAIAAVRYRYARTRTAISDRIRFHDSLAIICAATAKTALQRQFVFELCCGGADIDDRLVDRGGASAPLRSWCSSNALCPALSRAAGRQEDGHRKIRQLEGSGHGSPSRGSSPPAVESRGIVGEHAVRSAASAIQSSSRSAGHRDRPLPRDMRPVGAPQDPVRRCGEQGMGEGVGVSIGRVLR
jgi:hypothetical protein